MSRYSAAELKEDTDILLDRAIDGEEVTIERRGKVIKLVPEAAAEQPQRSSKALWDWYKDSGLPLEPSTPFKESGAETIRKMRDEEPGY